MWRCAGRCSVGCSTCIVWNRHTEALAWAFLILHIFSEDLLAVNVVEERLHTHVAWVSLIRWMFTPGLSERLYWWYGVVSRAIDPNSPNTAACIASGGCEAHADTCRRPPVFCSGCAVRFFDICTEVFDGVCLHLPRFPRSCRLCCYAVSPARATASREADSIILAHHDKRLSNISYKRNVPDRVRDCAGGR
jgi:hypothetical protein